MGRDYTTGDYACGIYTPPADPNEFIRGKVHRLIVNDYLGHDGVRIGERARLLRHVIDEEQRSRRYMLDDQTQAPTPGPRPPRTPECLTLADDRQAVLSYGTSRGLDPSTMSARRFDGTWCLWTARPGSPEACALQSGSAIDSASALNATINRVFELIGARNEHRMFEKLHHAIDDWEATIKGQTTSRTMTNEQLWELRPRPGHQDLVDAALRGEPSARHECLSTIRCDELERETNGELPRARTWSLWTSKGHPQDRRLVITRHALDALSFHQLHPDNRTRYVSFEGPATNTRDALLHRSMALMPPGSTVTVATDRSKEGTELALSIATLVPTLPTLKFEGRPGPSLGWHCEASRSIAIGRPSIAHHQGPKALDRRVTSPSMGIDR